MEYQRFTVSIENHIALVKINRPEKANSLDGIGWQELKQVFDSLDRDSTVRVIVLAGEGKHFCAGADQQFLMEGPAKAADQSPGHAREQLLYIIEELQDQVSAIEACRKPVLAAIQRACVGGAVDIISACDMRYCTEDAFFSVAEIDLGIVADLGTLQRLPKIIPEGIARELTYTGRRMDATEAHSVGLVNKRYADKESMMEDVMAIAAVIASKSPLAIRGCKQTLNYTRDHSVAEGLLQVRTWNAGMLLNDDLNAAMMAAMTKQPPQFRD